MQKGHFQRLSHSRCQTLWTGHYVCPLFLKIVVSDPFSCLLSQRKEGAGSPIQIGRRQRYEKIP